MKYLVRFKAKTLAAFLKRDEQQQRGYGWIRFNSNTVCYDILKNYGGDLIHWGIGVDTIIEADNSEEAIEIAKPDVSLIYYLISFCTNTEIGPIEESLIIEYEDEQNERDLKQIINQSNSEIPVGKLEKVDTDFLNLIAGKFFSLESNSTSRKYFRAFQSYSTALQQKNLSEIFVWYYIGFDALEYLFKKHYDVEGKISFECQNCGTETGSTTLANEGKKTFLNKHKLIDSEHSDLANIRNPLVHAGKLNVESEDIDSIERALRVGLLELLGIDPNRHQTILDKERNGHLRDEFLTISTSIHGYQPLALEKINEQPQILLTKPEIKYSINGEKLTRNKKSKHKFDFQLGDGVSQTEIKYKPSYEGHNLSPKLTKKDITLSYDEN